MPIDSQGHFEIFYAIANRTGAATIEFFDPGTSRRLQNRENHMDNIVAGGGGSGIGAGFGASRPFIWPESYFMNVEDAGRAMIVTFRDLTGAPNTIQLVLHGRRFYNKEAPYEVYEKMYQTFGRKERTNVYFQTTDDAAVIPAVVGSLLNSPSRVTDEADFEIFKITSSSTGAYEFRLRVAANSRPLSNDFVLVDGGTGSAEFPFIFQEPWLVERNHSIMVEFRNLIAGANTVFFTMTGRRLHYAQ
jgi:hypothetical protein